MDFVMWVVSGGCMGIELFTLSWKLPAGAPIENGGHSR